MSPVLTCGHFFNFIFISPIILTFMFLSFPIPHIRIQPAEKPEPCLENYRIGHEVLVVVTSKLMPDRCAVPELDGLAGTNRHDERPSEPRVALHVVKLISSDCLPSALPEVVLKRCPESGL